MTVKYPKPVRKRDRKYLEYVRQQGCVIHRTRAHAHHTESGGMGTKGSDYSCVGLCWLCHSELHDIGLARFELKYGLNLTEESARLLRKYFESVERKQA